MPWWGWIVLGAALLIAEILVPIDFYLVVLGSAAAAVGLLRLVGFDGPPWSDWLLFGVFSAAFLMTFRRIWGRVSDDDTQTELVVGEIAVANEAMEPGKTGRAELRGARWSACNVGSSAVAKGERLRVVRLDGLTIHVEGESSPAS